MNLGPVSFMVRGEEQAIPPLHPILAPKAAGAADKRPGVPWYSSAKDAQGLVSFASHIDAETGRSCRPPGRRGISGLQGRPSSISFKTGRQAADSLSLSLRWASRFATAA